MAASWLPPARQVYVDANGVPIVGGTVGYYVPATLTGKDTWQDSAQTILNANPLTLDSLGSAQVWGNGAYRQIVKDALGNTISDDLTQIGAPTQPYLTPQAYGAVGDGITDDTVAINAVLAAANTAGTWIDGAGLSYGVSGSIVLPDNVKMRNCAFNQLTPIIANCRTVTKTSGTGGVLLQNVKVNRGSQTAVGDPNNNAGMWFANFAGLILIDCEVTGNGAGIGILISACSNVLLVRPYIHDMTWSAAVDPGIDQLAGIRWANGCTQVRVLDAHISKLGGLIGANPIRYWQSDGMDPGGSDWQIIGGYIEFVNEGIDTHTSEGCTDFVISSVQCVSCDSYGLKIGNWSRRGVMTGCQSIGCGLTGFIINSTAPNVTSDLTFVNCQASNTGATGTWPGANTCGFAILQDYCNNIRLVECEAIDAQAVPTMKYGYRCDFAPNAAQTRMNVLRGCTAFGYITSATTGNIGEFICSVTRSTAQTIPNNAATAIVWNNTVDDIYVMSTGAGVVTIKESGLYEIDVGVELVANAAGQRILTILVNGVASSWRASLPGSAVANASLKLCINATFNIGDALSFTIFQDTGGTLDTIAGVSYVMVRRVYGGL